MPTDQILQSEELLIDATRELGVTVVVAVVLALVAIGVVVLLLFSARPILNLLVDMQKTSTSVGRESNQVQLKLVQVLESQETAAAQQTSVLQSIADALKRGEARDAILVEKMDGVGSGLLTLDDDLDTAMAGLREHVIATADKTVLALTERFDTVLVAVKALEALVRDYNAQTFTQNAEALNAISKLEQGVSTMRAALLEEIKLAVPIAGTGSTSTTEKIVAEGA